MTGRHCDATPTFQRRQGYIGGGCYVTPAVFADCTDGMRFVREEGFGPLLAVLRFAPEDEAIEHYTQVKTVYASPGRVPRTY